MEEQSPPLPIHLSSTCFNTGIGRSIFAAPAHICNCINYIELSPWCASASSIYTEVSHPYIQNLGVSSATLPYELPSSTFFHTCISPSISPTGHTYVSLPCMKIIYMVSNRLLPCIQRCLIRVLKIYTLPYTQYCLIRTIKV